MTEQERLRALSALDLLDTLPEEEYDQFVRLAASICSAPISLISLVDHNRQWFKASVGLNVRETPRNISFCDHAIRSPSLFVVNDATCDSRFERNPLVTQDPNIRFYAGVPLRAPGGALVGTICVIDTVPRMLTPAQRDALTIIGMQVQTRLELRARNRELTAALSKVEERERALTAANLELGALATTDALTGLSNRRVFDEKIATDFEVCRRRNRSVAVLVMDIDDFKQRNDEHGHAAGDEALRAVGKILRRQVRKGDMAARIGGEEFGYILNDCDSASATILAKRILQQVRLTTCGNSPLSISIGVASIKPFVRSAEHLLSCADEAMYAAKRAGKDRIVVHERHIARHMATPPGRVSADHAGLEEAANDPAVVA